MYCSDMSDSPVAASSKASVASAVTCIDYDDYNYCNKNIIMTIHVSHHSKAIIVYGTSILMTSKTHQL